MQLITLVLILSSISPLKSNDSDFLIEEFKKPKIEYRYIPRLEEPEHPFVIMPDPCPWLRKDYVHPYVPSFEFDIPKQEKQYYKKIPWNIKNQKP